MQHTTEPHSQPPLTAAPATAHLGLLVALATGVLISACGGGGGGGSAAPAALAPSSVSGFVVDGAGAGVSGAQIEVAGESLVTPVGGAFAFELAPGTYSLLVSVQGVSAATVPFDLSVGETLDLGAVQALSTVTGRAVDGSGDGLAGALVQVGGPVLQMAVTTTGGDFELQLPQGSYSLIASWQGHTMEPVPFDVAVAKNLDVGDVQTLVEFTGRLVDGLLMPVEGAIMTAFTAPDVYQVTDAEGLFTLQVPLGDHEILATLNGMVLFTEYVHVHSLAPVQAGTIQVLVRVTGRVIDDGQIPVEGAEILVDTAPMTISETAADGTFSLDLPVKTLQLCVRISGITVAQELLRLPNLVNQGVVGLDEIVVAPMGDFDGDGLGDLFEVVGWTILVDEYGAGEFTEREVGSDPGSLDADGDGLTDPEELAFKTDPSQGDTDWDLLTDLEELEMYKSHPAMVDTDRDSLELDADGEIVGVPNPLLFDGAEIKYSRTSPVLDDTDGDGIGDRVEVMEGGPSPLVADLPFVEFEIIGDPLITLSYTLEQSTEAQTASLIANQDASTSSVTNSHSETTASEAGVEATVAAEASFPGGSVSASATVSASESSSTTSDFVMQATQDSAQQMQNETAALESEAKSIDGGSIFAAVEVRNLSNLAIQLLDLDLIAFRVDALSGTGALQPIGLLSDGDKFGPGMPGLLLGPQDKTTMFVENKDLEASLVLNYLRNPAGLYLRVGNYSVRQVDEDEQVLLDYDVIMQNVVERTARLSIDWGNGQVDRHNIATNVERNSDGSAAGLRMEEALAQVLGLELETQVGEFPEAIQGKSVLVRLEDKPVTKNVDGYPTHFWMVVGPGAVDPVTGHAVDFEEVRLFPGETYMLMYATDLDADGLIAQEEQIYGTLDLNPDSDGDGVTDFDEIKNPYTVKFENCEGTPEGCDLSPTQLELASYAVFSNPRIADIDQDFLLDSEERVRRTDPGKRDSDGDSIIDPLDDCQGLGCGGLDTLQAMVCDLRFDQLSLLSNAFVLKDFSGNDNHGLVRELPVNLVPYQDSLLALESGLFLDEDRFDSYGGALLFVNDDIDNGEYSTLAPKAVIEIERKSKDAPELVAMKDGEGFTCLMWVRPDNPNEYIASSGGPFGSSFVSPGQKPFMNLLGQNGGFDGFSLNEKTFNLTLDKSGVLEFSFDSETGVSVSVASPGVQHSQWNQVGCTVSYQDALPVDGGGGVRVALFLDGDLLQAAEFPGAQFDNPSTAGSDDAQSLWVGWPYWADGGAEAVLNVQSYNGTIDSALIYDFALIDDEIENIFIAQTP